MIQWYKFIADLWIPGLDNLFDDNENTFVELVNEMALELSLKKQIELIRLIMNMKQGLGKENSVPNDLQRIKSPSKQTDENDTKARV